MFSISFFFHSAVGIATGYGLDDQGVGVRVLMWARIFTSPSQIQSQSQSYNTTDGQPASLSWNQAYVQIFIIVWQLQVFWFGAPSLTGGQVCLLYMLLALATAVFLRSESLGTRGHILLSQIWVFPFCRLLELAGSRWRYSIPPPHREATSPCRPDWLRGPPSLLSNGYQGLFPQA
jgi:hypothetical protein